MARGAGIPRPIVDEDLLGALTACLEAVRTDPDTWRLVPMPQEGAPRLLHERIAAVVAKLAQAPGRHPDPELAARMMSAYADGAARLVLDGHPVEPILQLTRWTLARLSAS